MRKSLRLSSEPQHLLRDRANEFEFERVASPHLVPKTSNDLTSAKSGRIKVTGSLANLVWLATVVGGRVAEKIIADSKHFHP